jgi:ribosome-binding protein aMBF1 (putative translation factor)
MEQISVKQRLKAIIAVEPSPLLKQAAWIEENDIWLERSALIALQILKRLRELAMTQKQLADLIGVSAQYINKVAQGRENLSLQTIGKIEKALGIILIDIPVYETCQEVNRTVCPDSGKL